MNKTGSALFALILCFFLLSACTTTTTSKNTLGTKNKNIEFNAVLTDPVIKQDFRSLKNIAANATLLSNGDYFYFDEANLKKLDNASRIIIDRLENHYHMNATQYKIHTFIGKNKSDSCFQYYDSAHLSYIGKTCQDKTSQFGSCSLCESFVNTVRSRTMRVIHVPSNNNVDTMALIDTFRLRNGDFVYLALELSP